MRRRSTPGCGAARVLGLTPADLHLDVATPYLRVRRTLLQDGTTDEPEDQRGEAPGAAADGRLGRGIAGSAGKARGAGPAGACTAAVARLPRSAAVPECCRQGFHGVGQEVHRQPRRCRAGGTGDHAARHPAHFSVNCRAAGMSASTASPAARAHLRGLLAGHLRAPHRRRGQHPAGAVRPGSGMSTTDRKASR